mmetsp:Transcript_32173/g.84986  ORF Transcript_32173/g.84986 Transcript_32173/m.84986 type:complete len:222 (+) Transcript_32173:1034-1699(+)
MPSARSRNLCTFWASRSSLLTCPPLLNASQPANCSGRPHVSSDKRNMSNDHESNSSSIRLPRATLLATSRCDGHRGSSTIASRSGSVSEGQRDPILLATRDGLGDVDVSEYVSCQLQERRNVRKLGSAMKSSFKPLSSPSFGSLSRRSSPHGRDVLKGSACRQSRRNLSSEELWPLADSSSRPTMPRATSRGVVERPPSASCLRTSAVLGSIRPCGGTSSR